MYHCSQPIRIHQLELWRLLAGVVPVRCEREWPDESRTLELNPAAFSSRELCKGGRREGGREGGREREGRREYIIEGDVKCYGL